MNPKLRQRLARLVAPLALIILAAWALLAWSCGGDDAPAPTKPAAPTAAATTAATAAAPTTAPAPSPTAAAATARETTEKLTVGGVQREAVVYVPAKLSAAKAPVIVYLTSPGFPNVAPRERYGIKLDAEADRLGFIAVWPAGTPAAGQGAALCCYWNHGNIDFGTQQAPDDIAFFKALLDLMIARYPADADRISFIGTAASSGAMSYRVACELGDRISAFVDVSSGHRDNTACAGAKPVSMLMMIGTAAIGYAGGISPTTGLLVPAATDVIDYWRKLDGCTGEAVVTMLTAATEQKRYGPCKGNTEVVLVTVKDGGNGWWGAGSDAAAAATVAAADPALKVTPIVAAFLIKQTRAGR